MEDYKSFIPNNAYSIIKGWLSNYNCKIVIKSAESQKMEIIGVHLNQILIL